MNHKILLATQLRTSLCGRMSQSLRQSKSKRRSRLETPFTLRGATSPSWVEKNSTRRSCLWQQQFWSKSVIRMLIKIPNQIQWLITKTRQSLLSLSHQVRPLSTWQSRSSKHRFSILRRSERVTDDLYIKVRSQGLPLKLYKELSDISSLIIHIYFINH